MDYLDEHQAELSFRYPTFRRVLDLLAERGGNVIVETGCTRMKDDWGAGMSTVIFADWCKNHGGIFYSVDNDKGHLATAHDILAEYGVKSYCTFIHSDSVAWLRQLGQQSVDLFYADSWDFPYVEMLMLHGYQDDQDKAIKELWAMSEEEVLVQHGDLIAPCQEHCLAEIMAIEPALKDTSIVLIDDQRFPGGGKPRLAKNALRVFGWDELSGPTDQQSLWSKSDAKTKTN